MTVAEEAIQLAERAFETDPNNLHLFQELSIIRSHLGSVLRADGNNKAADRINKDNLDEFRELLKKHSQKRNIHEDLLSVTLHQGFSVEEAEKLLQRYKDAAAEASAMEASEEDETGGLAKELAANKSEEPKAIHPVGTSDTTASSAIWKEFQGRNRYQLVSVLGEGGMGIVYRARDNFLIREVAIKSLRGNSQINSNERAIFLREILALSILDHPSIIPIFDIGFQEYSRGSSSGNDYFVMKLVEGRSLLQLTKSRRYSSWRDNRRWDSSLLGFAHVCDAIQHAHDRGIVHGDPKTSNVIVQGDGHVWLFDWGLCRLLEDQLAPMAAAWLKDKPLSVRAAITFEHDAGRIIGTLTYMAPEQARGERQSKKTDIYVLGASLYEILTGKPPLRSEMARFSVIEMLERIQHGAIPTPREIDESIPKRLERICLKALAVDPSDRFETASELGEEIRRWLPNRPAVD